MSLCYAFSSVHLIHHRHQRGRIVAAAAGQVGGVVSGSVGRLVSWLDVDRPAMPYGFLRPVSKSRIDHSLVVHNFTHIYDHGCKSLSYRVCWSGVRHRVQHCRLNEKRMQAVPSGRLDRARKGRNFRTNWMDDDVSVRARWVNRVIVIWRYD